MKFTKVERLDIGRRIYDGEISRYEPLNSMVSILIQLEII